MTEAPPLQTSSIPDLFDVRDHDFNLLGYTKHSPDLCHGFLFQIPVNSRSRHRPFSHPQVSAVEPENEWAVGRPNWRVVSLTVEYMMYEQNRFKTWVCGADDAVALVQSKWICAIGEDNMSAFIDMLRRREMEQMRSRLESGLGGARPFYLPHAADQSSSTPIGSSESTWQTAAIAFPRRDQSSSELLQPQPVQSITISDKDAVVTFGTRKIVIPRTQE